MTTNTNTAPADIYDLSLKALTEYLKDCDEHAIEPDVGGAFANAFRAGAALSAAQPPAGWVMVPMEPTEEMIAHAHQACDGTYAGDVYRAMLTAAPKVEPVQQPGQTLLNIGREIGFGRAQQILGELWEAEHGCAPRGRMGVTVRDSAKTVPAPREPLTREQMEKGREAIFSTGNPYCPCDSKTFRKVAEWVERHHGIGARKEQSND